MVYLLPSYLREDKEWLYPQAAVSRVFEPDVSTELLTDPVCSSRGWYHFLKDRTDENANHLAMNTHLIPNFTCIKNYLNQRDGITTIFSFVL